MVMVEWSKFGKAKLKSLNLIYWCSLFKPVALELIKQNFLGSNWNYSFSVARAAAWAPAENQKLPVANTFSAPDLQASDPTSAESAYPLAMAFLKITWCDTCEIS